MQEFPAATYAWFEVDAACFRVEPLAQGLSQGYLRIWIEAEGLLPQLRIAPAYMDTPLVFTRASGRLRLAVAEAKAKPLGAAEALWTRIKSSFPPARAAVLRFGPVTVRPDAHRRKARVYLKLLKSLQALGVALDGDGWRPELAFGWGPAPPMPMDAPQWPSIAVVVHLHYVELWPEIAGLLRGWGRPLRLLASLTREDAAARAQILADFPDAAIEVVDNKGRDVRPFLLWLESGRLDGFDLICKLHSKRTLRPTVPILFGDMARRACFLDLIADPANVAAIVSRFRTDPHLGVVGPQRFRARPDGADLAEFLGRNCEAVAALARRMGAPVTADGFDFFSNTMFWARPQALAPLRQLRLSAEFAAEAGLTDGGLEHAVERLFNHSARTAGFSVEGTRAA